MTLTVPREELRYWHPAEKRWVMEPGEYCFRLCSDCRTVRLQETIALEGEALPAACDGEIMRAFQSGRPEQLTDAAYERLLGARLPQEPPKRPLTTESRFTDFRQTFMGRILFKAVLSVAAKQEKKGKAMPEGPERDNTLKGALFLKRVMESNCLRSMSMSAGKVFPWHFAEGFVSLANGHLLKGIRCLLSPVKVPALPKDK